MAPEQTKTPECSVIIPVHNKWELTRNCLVSLREHSSAHDLEVIVVDDASTDATASDLVPLGESLFGGRFSAITFSENRSFGPACNAGAKAAAAPLLFFLNNDTILTPGWAGPLLETMQGDNAPGAAGPLLLHEDNTVQHLGVTIGARDVFHLYQDFPASHPVVSRPRPLQFITAAAFLVPRELFFACGGFFEGYKNGFEDLDLCLQIRKQGRRLECIAASRIYHLEGKTRGGGISDGRGEALFEERCGKDIYTDIHLHALRDGFSPRLNDLFALSVCLKPAEEVALLRKIPTLSAEALFRMIREHPYLLAGREALATGLERAEKYEEAVLFRIDAAEIEPTPERYGALLELAQRVADAPWAEQIARKLEMMRYYRENPPRFEQVFPKMPPEGDVFLEELYREKIRKIQAAS